jgi:hypothetical protein
LTYIYCSLSISKTAEAKIEKSKKIFTTYLRRKFNIFLPGDLRRVFSGKIPARQDALKIVNQLSGKILPALLLLDEPVLQSFGDGFAL